MWVQMDREQVGRLVRLAHVANQLDIAEKLRHYVNLDRKKAKSIARYRQAADELYGEEGSLEFDDDAVVSGGIAQGAYVMGWRWIEARDLKRIGTRQRVKSEC